MTIATVPTRKIIKTKCRFLQFFASFSKLFQWNNWCSQLVALKLYLWTVWETFKNVFGEILPPIVALHHTTNVIPNIAFRVSQNCIRASHMFWRSCRCKFRVFQGGWSFPESRQAVFKTGLCYCWLFLAAYLATPLYKEFCGVWIVTKYGIVYKGI